MIGGENKNWIGKTSERLPCPCWEEFSQQKVRKRERLCYKNNKKFYKFSDGRRKRLQKRKNNEKSNCFHFPKPFLSHFIVSCHNSGRSDRIQNTWFSSSLPPRMLFLFLFFLFLASLKQQESNILVFFDFLSPAKVIKGGCYCLQCSRRCSWVKDLSPTFSASDLVFSSPSSQHNSSLDTVDTVDTVDTGNIYKLAKLRRNLIPLQSLSYTLLWRAGSRY